MLKLLLIFVIFLTLQLSNVQSEFVTLWTPKFVQEDAAYRIIALPTDLNDNTEVAVQFRTSNATFTLTNGKIGAIEYGSKERNFGDIKSYDLTMTLLRNVSGNQMHCSTKKISVDTKTGTFYNFIQTDKPIYKPGDVVQFRVLTVDKDLLPYHRDSINVTITDPAGRKMYNFMNQAGKYIGVFDNNFTLSTETTLGDWMVTVVVDRKDKTAVSKIFSVQKLVLPIYEVYIDMPEVNFLGNEDLKFSFYGKYSFGSYVKGNAEVGIRNPKSKEVYFKESHTNIQYPIFVTKNLGQILTQIDGKFHLEVYCSFKEASSGIQVNKTVPFYLHSEENRIVATHPDKFLPGLPFAVKVSIFNWKNEQIISNSDEIEINFTCSDRTNSNETTTISGQLNNNGYYINEFEVPLICRHLVLEVAYVNSHFYRSEIDLGTVNVGMNSLIVSHSPINPNHNDTLQIFTKSDESLKSVMYVIVTRYGNSDAKQVDCKGKLLCDFDVDMEETMMPQSTIMVYDVRDQQTIYQGKTEVETQNLGDNYLTVELPTTKAKTRQDINMKFTTKARSKVYMLAIDKRLTFLRDGNDIVKEDVMKSVADYDGENKILVDDLTSWTVCTPEEVKRVESGRTQANKVSSSLDIVYPEEHNDDIQLLARNQNIHLMSTNDVNQLHANFPETWIFDSFDVGSQSSFQKSYMTPNSMTTWQISAFSVHKDYGLAFSPKQDLVVRDEFFIEMNLPYSIRYTEVFKLEILVFNFIDTKEPISVELKLNNLNDGMEFQFVDYSDDCTPTYHEGTSATSKVNVEANGMSTVHFYIRSNPLDNNFKESKEKLMTLDVEATAKTSNGQTYHYHIQKPLIIKPFGVKIFEIVSESFKLDGGSSHPYFQMANYSQDLLNIDVEVTGDYLTERIIFDKASEFKLGNTMDQMVRKLKRNVEIFNYFDVKGKNPSNQMLTEQYQSILSRYNENLYGSASFKSNLGDILAKAMIVGAIPMDKNVVFKFLDGVRNLQENSGTFQPENFDFTYKSPGSQNKLAQYRSSIEYHAAAYCLIPMIRQREFMDNRYTDFMRKGFDYLNNEENQKNLLPDAYVVAAYVYALDHQTENAKKILKGISHAFTHLKDGKACYKVSTYNGYCDLVITSYAALAYMELNDFDNAEKLVNFLLVQKHNYGTTLHFYGIIVEAIATFGVRINSKNTNLEISIRNEINFQKNITISDTNSNESQVVHMPHGSEVVKFVVTGYGFCTLSAIFERIITVPVVDNSFNLRISTSIGLHDNTRSVNVCAMYKSLDASPSTLQSVVYEVEMPSGYIYNHFIAFDHKENIKDIRVRSQSTLVDLYMKDIESNVEYCILFTANQQYIVNKPTNAGIKVYDFNNKERVAVAFYKFDDDECSPY